MTRQYASDITSEEREHLEGLLESAGDTDSYRERMTDLGRSLGHRVRRSLDTPELVVVCTVEDADFLAQGFLDGIGDEVPANLVCFWNKRGKIGETKIAPVIQRYEEPFDPDRIHQLVVLKSIISTGCVVKTNLLELLERVNPHRIFITAPVLHNNSQESLEAEFPDKISKTFDYTYLAIDDEKDGSNIHPGVGGNVYELLGLGDMNSKNRVQPELVQRREARIWSSR